MSMSRRTRSVLATPFYLGLLVTAKADRLMCHGFGMCWHHRLFRAVGGVWIELILLVYPEYAAEVFEKLARRAGR